MAENEINWRLLLGQGLVSLLFSLLLATAGSMAAYLMLSSQAQRDPSEVLGMTYIEAAPRLASVVYGVFFLIAMLALSRLRIYEQVATRPRFHWVLAFIFYTLIGLLPGVIYWLLFSAADRPGI